MAAVVAAEPPMAMLLLLVAEELPPIAIEAAPPADAALPIATPEAALALAPMAVALLPVAWADAPRATLYMPAVVALSPIAVEVIKLPVEELAPKCSLLFPVPGLEIVRTLLLLPTVRLPLESNLANTTVPPESWNSNRSADWLLAALIIPPILLAAADWIAKLALVCMLVPF